MMRIEPGDQIKIAIWFKGNPFTHHGIYVGDYYLTGGTKAKKGGVVHFEKVGGVVKLKHTDLEGFCKGRERLDEIEIVDHGYFSHEQRMDVVARSLKCVQEYESYGNDFFKKLFGHLNYDIADFNCEHFATECRLGYKQSLQADLLRPIWQYRFQILEALRKGVTKI
jgi:Lecithin retinol acyltransferase